MRLSTKFVLLEMLLLFLFTFGVYTLIYLAGHYQKKDKQHAVQDVLDNWKTDFVMEFIATKKNKCTDLGKNYKELFVYPFSGTSDPYCLCNDEFLYNSEGFSVSSDCKSRFGNYDKVGCQLFKGIPKQDLTMWKDGYKFCGERVRGSNFINLAKNNHGKCSSDTIPCGNLEKPSELLCLSKKKFTKCPISGISFKGSLMTIERKGKLPLVDFEVREAGMCSGRDWDTETDKRDYPEVLNVPKVSNCTKDPRFYVEDSWSEFDYFQMNNLPVEQMKKVELVDKKYSYSLITRNVIKLAPSCRGMMGSLDVSRPSMLTNKWFKIAGITVGILIFLLLLWSFLSAWLRKVLLWPVRTALAFAMMVLIVGFILYLWIRYPNYYKKYREFGQNKCSDDFTNNQFLNTGNDLRSSLRYLILAFFYGLVMMILFAVLAFLHQFFMKKRKRGRSQDLKPGDREKFRDSFGEENQEKKGYQEFVEKTVFIDKDKGVKLEETLEVKKDQDTKVTRKHVRETELGGAGGKKKTTEAPFIAAK